MAKLLRSASAAAKTGFSLTGAVIGAGFLSGAELVRFFPSAGFFPYLAVAALLFFGGFLLLSWCGRRFGGFEGTLRRVFAARAPWVRAAVLAGSFITCGSMLAGAGALAQACFGGAAWRAAAALAGTVLVYVLAHGGMRGLFAVNFVLVPLILLFVAFYAVAPGAAAYGRAQAEGDAFGGLCRVLLYAGMNLFLAAPLACDAGARAGATAAAAGCAAAALLVGAGAAVVLANVCAAGDALYAEMPFFRAVGARGGAGVLFVPVSLCGIFTTLIASYYPLHNLFGGKRRAPVWRALLCAAIFLFSQLGLARIVQYVYPLLGGAGLVFLIGCLRPLLRSFFEQELLRQRDKRIHARRKHAQDRRCRHHKV